jgi:hypothetical protein
MKKIAYISQLREKHVKITLSLVSKAFVAVHTKHEKHPTKSPRV